MERDNHERQSFLRSLLHDRTANTIVISAAAMIPLMAMVGGGVDASRYYMTASRMQAACDAGALAARRAMTTDEFTTAHRDIGLDFYDQNFSQGMFGVENGTRAYTSDGDGTVTGTASGTPLRLWRRVYTVRYRDPRPKRGRGKKSGRINLTPFGAIQRGLFFAPLSFRSNLRISAVIDLPHGGLGQTMLWCRFPRNAIALSKRRRIFDMAKKSEVKALKKEVKARKAKVAKQEGKLKAAKKGLKRPSDPVRDADKGQPSGWPFCIRDIHRRLPNQLRLIRHIWQKQRRDQTEDGYLPAIDLWDPLTRCVRLWNTLFPPL